MSSSREDGARVDETPCCKKLDCSQFKDNTEEVFIFQTNRSRSITTNDGLCLEIDERHNSLFKDPYIYSTNVHDSPKFLNSFYDLWIKWNAYLLENMQLTKPVVTIKQGFPF